MINHLIDDGTAQFQKNYEDRVEIQRINDKRMLTPESKIKKRKNNSEVPGKDKLKKSSYLNSKSSANINKKSLISLTAQSKTTTDKGVALSN